MQQISKPVLFSKFRNPQQLRNSYYFHETIADFKNQIYKDSRTTKCQIDSRNVTIIKINTLIKSFWLIISDVFQLHSASEFLSREIL